MPGGKVDDEGQARGIQGLKGIGAVTSLSRASAPASFGSKGYSRKVQGYAHFDYRENLLFLEGFNPAELNLKSPACRRPDKNALRA